MTFFLWFIAVTSALDVLARIGRLSRGDHARTPREEMINAIGNSSVMVWALMLIAYGVQNG